MPTLCAVCNSEIETKNTFTGDLVLAPRATRVKVGDKKYDILLLLCDDCKKLRKNGNRRVRINQKVRFI